MGNAEDALPPRWVDLADRVNEIVDKARPKSECWVVARYGGTWS